MKLLYFGLILLFFGTNVIFWTSAEMRQSHTRNKLKHALESAANSAGEAVSYRTEDDLYFCAEGFLTEVPRTANGLKEGAFRIDPVKAYANFEQVLFSNLGTEKNEKMRNEVRDRILLCAVIQQDGIQFREPGGAWSVKENFASSISGGNRELNFSKPEEWAEINYFILEKINGYLLRYGTTYSETSKRYLSFLSDVNETATISGRFEGPGFIAICDGILLPGMGIQGREILQSFSIGGSDLIGYE